MKNIKILATGGTIAGKGGIGQTAHYKPGELCIEALMESIPCINELAFITGEQILNTASDNLTSEDLLTIAKKINILSKQDTVDGFVITCGTDTLEEFAYFLNLTVKTNKPVVCVGAMRPSTATSADGPFNLYQAVALASSEDAIGQGVLVIFSDCIYAARDVQKISTFRTEGFGNRDLGCLGYMRDATCHFLQKSTKKHTVASEFDITNIEALPCVAIVYFYLDADTTLLDCALKSVDGLVIASAGNGGYSTIWRETVSNTQRDIPVVVSSRVSNGLVTLHQGDPKQCIPSDTLNPQKARILLQLALTKTKDIKSIADIFAQY